MANCPHCSKKVPEGAAFCPSCGGGMEAPKEVSTVTSLGDEPARPPGRPHGGSDPSSASGGRFLPGTLLAGRYRVIGLIGRGGMGEVYRADDLKLGRTVALKFLPQGHEEDPSRQERFLEEIRLALEVSHPNVCRVHDIGEAEGLLFLSMEYVDGEDLASLLRRIGRLPRDKAIQIARQLCAGLAAAHEQGILHRDLKPANVMLDGKGRAKITDFGLAGLERELEEGQARAGTPSYMAPEQLEGKAVTVKSDLYALGLVLYELFTGKPVYEGQSPAEISRLQRSSEPSTPSSHVEDFDPEVERAILRCLEHDPARRPASALAVAAALPGGDPLAEALAAGETPSPEMVAAAGALEPALRPLLAVGCVAFFLVALGLGLAYRTSSGVPGMTGLLDFVPTPEPPAVLARDARDLLEGLGWEEAPRDTAHGYGYDDEYLEWIVENDPSPDRWARLEEPDPAALYFWYRRSPRLLVPSLGTNPVVTPRDPPPLRHAGEVVLTLDTEGRLRSLEAVPPKTLTRSPSVEPPWEALFQAAGLSMDAYEEIEPTWTPPVYADTLAAWQRREEVEGDGPDRIEAAAFAGRPVFFERVGPWRRPERTAAGEVPWTQTLANAFFLLLFVCVLVGGVLLARHNLRLGRGDRRGALRLSLVFLLLVWIADLVRMSHVSSLGSEILLVYRSVLDALFIGGLTWLVYIALEPFARKHWPVTLISWSRLLAGKVRDPLIGRDIVVGAAVAGMALLLLVAGGFFNSIMGTLPPAPEFRREEMLLGGGTLAATLIWQVINPVIVVMNFLFILLVLRKLVRFHWLAVGLLVVPLAAMGAIASSAPWFVFILDLTLWTIIVAMLSRLGFLAPCFVLFFLDFANRLAAADLATWYADRTVLVFVLMIAVLGYGLWTSIGGRAYLERAFAAEP